MPKKDDDRPASPPATSTSSSSCAGAGAGEDDPSEDLADEDEALLRELGQWLYEHEDEDVTAIELLVEPSPAPLTAAQLEAYLEPLVRPRRRAWLQAIVSHAAVAAAAVVLMALWPASPHPKAELDTLVPVYELDLRGGEATTLGSSTDIPLFAPDSVFDLRLRPSHPVTEPIEVLITACPVDTGCGTRILQRLGPEQLEPNEHGVLGFESSTVDVLPLAPGRWELTFEVGADGSCLLPSPERRCVEVARKTVDLVGAEVTNAP